MSNEPGLNAPQQPEQPHRGQQNWGAGQPPPPPQGGQWNASGPQQQEGYPGQPTYPGQQYQDPQQQGYPGPQGYPGQQYQGYAGPASGGSPSQAGGLAPNIAAMLSYLLFGWIGGLIMYLTQKDREVRFHAAQSILTFGGLAIISVFLNIVNAFAGSALLALVSLFVSLVSFVLWIFLSIQGYQLKHTKLPAVGDIAEQWAAK